MAVVQFPASFSVSQYPTCYVSIPCSLICCMLLIAIAGPRVFVTVARAGGAFEIFALPEWERVFFNSDLSQVTCRLTSVILYINHGLEPLNT